MVGAIVTEAGPYPSNDLSPISYVASGLEDTAILKAVCETPEDG